MRGASPYLVTPLPLTEHAMFSLETDLETQTSNASHNEEHPVINPPHTLTMRRRAAAESCSVPCGRGNGDGGGECRVVGQGRAGAAVELRGPAVGRLGRRCDNDARAPLLRGAPSFGHPATGLGNQNEAFGKVNPNIAFGKITWSLRYVGQGSVL